MFLRRAINSVLNQTFRDFRLCVYDNASGDETGAVLEEFRKRDPRVEYYCRPQNIGAFANFVDGANRVETEFFSFLPDDDMMLPTFMADAISGFKRYPESALSMLATLHMSPGGLLRNAYVLKWPEGLIPPPHGMLCCVRYGNPGLPAMLIRRGAWISFGGFDEETEPGSDFDFQLRVCAHCTVVVSRKPGAIQVMHRGAATATGGLNWVWPSLPRIIDKATKDVAFQSEDARDAIEMLTRRVKRGLITKGIIRSMSFGRWEEAERAANIFARQYRGSRVAGLIPAMVAIIRKIPGSPLLPRAALAVKDGISAVRYLNLTLRFRSHKELLRTSAV
jgi:hypothetical protein